MENNISAMIHIIANRYSVAQKIGSGGMGDVYRGEDQRTGTPVAIKTLKSDVASEEIIKRFIREGEALRQLNHPNIVTLLDAVQEDDQYYLVMELVEGGALDEILRRIPRLPVRDVLNIALDLADALTRAHRLNIIHRDIKPANVLLATDGMPRLTDFGIAHVTGSDITETGSLMGTAAYIAPEVIEGHPADPRSDIWSLGVMLFEMLSGTHPFRADNPASVIYAILTQALPDLESLCPDAPLPLVDLVNRMVMRSPEERIPRMRLVGAELELILAGDTLNAVVEGSFTLVASGVEVHGNRFATPSPVSGSAVPNNLPAQTTQFVGRETELIELEKLIHLPATRLLTILAPGGMGKTRLSLELAAKLLLQARRDTLFESGIYFVDLAPLTSADYIVQAIAEAAGYAFQQDGREAKQQLFDYLRDKNSLLILDNFEHVLAGRTVVQEILQTAPLVKILTTSREKLNLNAETVFILSGMEFPEWETPEDALEYGSVKLFMQSARRVRSDFELQADELTHIARICRLVQGTPLGILLAAAWLEALSPLEIAQEISRSLDFLETEMHDLPERQRSLRAVFEYSWNLLEDHERTLFQQFAIFRGGFAREAVQHITGTHLRTLTVMVNKSLLRRDNVSGRYEIHELLRQYAEEKLNESADIETIREAHGRFYAGLMFRLAPKLKGHGQLETLNTIETEFENVRTAWNWAVKLANADVIRQMLEGMYLFLTFRNRVMDGEQLFHAARQVWNAAGQNPQLIAGQVLVRYPEQPPLAHFRRGLEIAEQHDAVEIAFCQRLVGHHLSHSEFNQDEGIPFLLASLEGYQAISDRFYMAQVLDDLGWSYQLASNREKQKEVVKRSLDLRQEIGDKIGSANTLRNMGGSVGGFFEPTGLANDYWQQAKVISYEMNDRLGVAWNASLQAAHFIFKGDFDQAMTLLDEGYPHAADVNDPVVKGFIQIMRGIVAALRDEDYLKAKSLIEEGYPPGSTPDFRTMLAPFGMSLVACGLRDFSPLLPLIELYRSRPPFNREAFYVPFFTAGSLITLADKGESARASELMRGFLDFDEETFGVPFPMAWARQWGLIARLRDSLEASLGSEAFQAAWERGTQITINDLASELQRFVEEYNERR
jgi:predicted ATPase